MAGTGKFCQCCYAPEGLETLRGPELDIFSMIYNYQGFKIDNNEIDGCRRCRDFLEEIRRFKIDELTNPDVKNYKIESMLKNVIDENTSQIEVETDEYDEVNCDPGLNNDNYDQNINSNDKPFSCGSCSFKTSCNRYLKRHTGIHTNKRLFICDYCEYSAKTRSRILEHIQLHMNKQNKPYKCSECEFETVTIHCLKSHVMSKHSDEKPFACEECNFHCKTKSALTDHKKKHLKDCDKPYKCNECSYKSASSFKLKRHAACKHSDEKPFSCDRCDYRAKIKPSLTVHKRIHLNDSEIPLKCSECSYKTNTRKQLNNHLVRKHSDEKPFSCAECDYRAKTKGDLIIHKRTHLNGHDNPYKCSECSYKTTTSFKLKVHIVRKHIAEQKSSIRLNRPFECSECSYNATSSSKLKSHAMKHSDVKPFACDQCSFRCKLKIRLVKHKKTHSKNRERPFECGECSCKFFTVRELKIHTLLKHSDEKPLSCDRCDYRCKIKHQLARHRKIHSKY